MLREAPESASNADKQPCDERLRAAILAALAADPQTAAGDLRVGVLNAVVHLGGVAPAAGVWAAAEHIAGAVPGVRGVVNRIEAPGAPCPARMINLNLQTIPGEGKSS